MIYSQDIKAGTRFIVNGVTYTAETADLAHGYTVKYIVTARTDAGKRTRITLWGGDQVAVAPDIMPEARAWVADCQWADGDTCELLSDAAIRAGIDRHYDGGWAGFVASCG
jgi:hypothetical protein